MEDGACEASNATPEDAGDQRDHGDGRCRRCLALARVNGARVNGARVNGARVNGALLTTDARTNVRSTRMMNEERADRSEGGVRSLRVSISSYDPSLR